MAKCERVDPATCPAGAGMSGMGPLHKTMVSLGTARSNPPQGLQISMHVPLVYRAVSMMEVIDMFHSGRWTSTVDCILNIQYIDARE